MQVSVAVLARPSRQERRLRYPMLAGDAFLPDSEALPPEGERASIDLL
jgi:hypothetical protein